jgi:hypothetical protein
MREHNITNYYTFWHISVCKESTVLLYNILFHNICEDDIFLLNMNNFKTHQLD